MPCCVVRNRELSATRMPQGRGGRPPPAPGQALALGRAALRPRSRALGIFPLTFAPVVGRHLALSFVSSLPSGAPATFAMDGTRPPSGKRSSGSPAKLAATLLVRQGRGRVILSPEAGRAGSQGSGPRRASARTWGRLARRTSIRQRPFGCTDPRYDGPALRGGKRVSCTQTPVARWFFVKLTNFRTPSTLPAPEVKTDRYVLRPVERGMDSVAGTRESWGLDSF